MRAGHALLVVWSRRRQNALVEVLVDEVGHQIFVLIFWWVHELCNDCVSGWAPCMVRLTEGPRPRDEL